MVRMRSRVQAPIVAPFFVIDDFCHNGRDLDRIRDGDGGVLRDVER